MADTEIFAWLGRAAMCGDVDVERSAEMLKNYYQGVGPEPEYADPRMKSLAAANEKIATEKANRKERCARLGIEVIPYDELREAAMAIVNRWDTPLWSKEVGTSELINNLRAALASRPAEVDDEGLPPLPTATWLGMHAGGGDAVYGYTAEQFRQGQRDAVAADRASMPAVLFDGHAVYSEITRKLGKAHCHSHETVSETLDAVVRLLRSAPSHTTNKDGA